MRSLRIGRTSWLALLLGLACFTAGPVAMGELVISEPFAYDVGDLLGQNGGTGWGSAWDVFISSGQTGSATVESGSLAFSDYATSGNRLRMSSSDSADPNSTKYVRPFRTTGAEGVTSGDLWVSFLYQRIDDASQWTGVLQNGWSSDGAQLGIRVNNNPGIHFRMRPNKETSAGIYVRYGDTGVTNAGDGTQTSVDGNTYLFVTQFKDVNTDTIKPQIAATMWMLSEADYDAVKGGGLLNDNYTLKAVAPDFSESAWGLEPASDLRLLHLYRRTFANENHAFVEDLDELRFGNTLADVGLPAVGIPEPSTLLLAVIGCVLALSSGRCRRT
ncbi:MAG: hypothetical protein ACC628_24190 [Pirellulaceae bacterium]